ncbi:MAG: hypothetical protein Q8M83_01785 [bacterium]|nr:hypothetical protein [bacterium]
MCNAVDGGGQKSVQIGETLDQVIERERKAGEEQRQKEGGNSSTNMPPEGDRTCWVPNGGC